jgi:hypothetical protein
MTAAIPYEARIVPVNEEGDTGWHALDHLPTLTGCKQSFKRGNETLLVADSMLIIPSDDAWDWDRGKCQQGMSFFLTIANPVLVSDDVHAPSTGAGIKVGKGSGVGYLLVCAHMHNHGPLLPESQAAGFTKKMTLMMEFTSEQESTDRGFAVVTIWTLLKVTGVIRPEAISEISIRRDFNHIDEDILAPIIAFSLHNHGHADNIRVTRERNSEVSVLSDMDMRGKQTVSFMVDGMVLQQNDSLILTCRFNNSNNKLPIRLGSVH